MRVGVLCFCLLALTACSRRGPLTPSPIDRQVILAPGQTEAISEAGIRLRFEGVSGDSRCPADAFCVQGGDALVHVEVLPSDGGQQAYVLHTGDMRPVMHGDLTIALVQLSPYPFSSRTIEPADYRATLRVTR
jgi:predicted small lipoprotein YifL